MFSKLRDSYWSSKSESKMSCNQEMIRMIGVLNNLQDKLVSLGVTSMVKQLPQIVVVGSQSSGKSSVLESFVGRDFLPRGEGLVTRRPLILQLKQNRDDSRTFARFNHLPKVELTDFDEIRDEICSETNRTVSDSGISADPINLMITSPDVLDLNLIDLPGVVKVASDNQPKDIEAIVKDLIIGYIKNENCLILAVTQANQDLSTSDAIKLAREVDPLGKRTIGVLTKLDIMDRGTDASKILADQHMIKLSKGFIGVINRSQKDIENKKELSEAIADERKFFRNHPAYKNLMHKVGIENLQRYLQKELGDHLFVELPALKNKLIDELSHLNERIAEISFTIDELTPNEFISETIETFRRQFRNEIGIGEDAPIDRDNGAAVINEIMNVKYARQLQTIERDQIRLRRETTQAVKNIRGISCDVSVPNEVFAIVKGKQIDLMRSPSLNCVEEICVELNSIVKQSAEAIATYPILMDMCVDFTIEFLRDCKKRCTELVNHKLDTEKDYLSDNQVTKIKRTNKVKAQVTREGWIKYIGTDFYFVLKNRTLYWYPDSDKQPDQRKSIDLNLAETTLNDKQIVLTKIGPMRLCNMTLEFQTKTDVREWAIHLINNIYDDNDVQEEDQTNVANHSMPRPVKHPFNIAARVEEVRGLVMGYVKITEKNLKDTIPKLCKKELINATEKFIANKLRNEIQSQELKIDDLMNRGPMIKERHQLQEKQSLYEETLKEMNQVIKSSTSN